MRTRRSTPDRPEAPESAEELRDKIIGLGERSGRKSFYPELRERLSTLERFRALLDQTHDAILVADVRGGLLSDVNQATCRMLGFDRDELLGRPVDGLSPAIAERIGLARPGQVVAALRARSGPEIPVEATLAFRAEGATHLAVVVARDIGERQRSERALRESEERFRAVFEGAAIGIAVVDLRGPVQSTNRALQELLGHSAAELRGRPFLSLVDEQDRARLGELQDGLLRGASERASLELRLARADGLMAWAQVSASLVSGDDGAPAHLVAAFQDITVRKRAQEALEFLSRASVRLASSLDVGGTLRNLTELAVPFLGSFCAISASTGEPSRENRLVACLDPAQQQAAEALLAERSISEILRAASWGEGPLLASDGSALLLAAASGDPRTLELVRRLEFRTLMFVPLAVGGRRLGALLLATGRSERRYGPFDLELATEFGHRAALALENAGLLLRAQEANRLKDEFLAIVSHELRTPLTAILGWTGLLQAGKLGPDKARSGLAVIERNARALAQIIDDLLGVSRIMAGKLAIHPEPLDLAPVVEGALEALGPAAEAGRISLRAECEELPPILGDPSRLQQVLWNLLSNAVKYTPEGGDVLVRVKRAGPCAEITVSDNGRGIDPEFLPHVFEAFRQADSSNTRRYGGLGLGLAIVRHLVQLHGGTVRAASDGEGRGATFTVTLPLAGGDAAASAPRRESELPRLPDLRVLLVEDDPDTLELLTEILQRQGARVVGALSAGEALAELDRAAPDVLISDIAMPEQDGISLLRVIRSRGCQVPAVALTALSREEDRARALAAGFEAYLVKPVDPAVLLRTVARRQVH